MKMDLGWWTTILAFLFPLFANFPVNGYQKRRQSKTDIRIGSFNLKQFGAKKGSNAEVLKTVAKIITRYDLIALQEVTDVKENVMGRLIDEIDRQSKKPYDYLVSERVGRTKQKEQYVLIFRTDLFKVDHHQLFNDERIDIFSREPQIAVITIKANDVKLGLVNVHVAPRNASTEIDALVDVHSWVEDYFNLQNIIILGDLNADCEYLRKKHISSVRLMTQPDKFKWLIERGFDTTVGNTKCAYDRIIVSGQYLQDNVVPNSAAVFKFDDAYKLEKAVALNVSDHYPVEFLLRSEDIPPKPKRENKSTIASSGGLLSSNKLTFFGVAAAITVLRDIFSYSILPLLVIMESE